MQETVTVWEHSAFEMLQLERTFKQEMKKSLMAWLWVIGAENLSSGMTTPSLRQSLYSLRHCEGSQSLMDWFIIRGSRLPGSLAERAGVELDLLDSPWG